MRRRGTAGERRSGLGTASSSTFADRSMPCGELRDRIAEADLPGTHVGINAGPLVYENGDFYGRTVNIAARIAAHAEQGQVLVSEDVLSHGSSDDIGFRRVGPVSFKGVSRDVVIYEAERA